MLADLIGLRRTLAALAGGLPLLFALVGAASAQARLDARYDVSLAGLLIGRGTWAIDIGSDQYVAAASGKTTGLLRVFSNGEGSTASRGTVSHGNLVPSSYAQRVTSDRQTEDLRITLAGGNVKDYSVEPPGPPQPDRIPVTEAHRRGVIDPMSGVIGHVPGTGNLLSPETCKRKVAVFDGRMRYDLRLAYKRMETVKADKGYQGPAVVCAVSFVPIAGYVPQRKAIKYLAAQRDMEVWVVPISGTRMVVPFRFSVPTPLGLGVLEATQFVATPQPSRAAAANVKVQ